MDHTVNLSRELYLPRELVFEVWVDPAHLGGWYAAEDQTFAADPGGFRLLDDSGAVIERVAARQSRAPERLEWRVHCGGAERRVTVTFAGGRGVCTMELGEERFADAAERDRRGVVWRERLRRLEQYFAAI